MKRSRSVPPRAVATRSPTTSLLAAALRGLPEGVVLFARGARSDSLKIVFVNETFSRITGYDADEIVGGGHAFLHVEAADLATQRRWMQQPAAERPFSGEGYLTHKNGSRVYAAWTFSALTDARGRVTHVVGSYRNMTEKRRLQEALAHAQRLDAVGRLAGGVAHDFNNLLSVINGYCEILAETVAGHPKALKEVGEIHRAGRRATTLVRQLLAFGRRQTLDPRVLNLNQLVQENAEILGRLLTSAQALQLSLAPTLGNIRADASQMQQVLLNLTINARDALAEGGQLTISTRSHQVKPGLNRRATDMPPGAYVVLAVSDNGIGMDDETRAHLFEPFFTTKPEGQGTGLGLALVYGVVQQSGGHIFVHSAPRLGSTFEIFFPLVEQPVSLTRGSLPPLPATAGRETVLLCEADPVVRKMAAGILAADGYRVLEADSTADAWPVVRNLEQRLHLLIIDTTEDVASITKLLRKLQPVQPHLGILWSGAEPPPRLEIVPAAAQGTLLKPFALSALLTAVRTLLDTAARSSEPAARSAS